MNGNYNVIAAVSALICLVLSVLLLFFPKLFRAANRMSKKWFSTSDLERDLNRTRDIDAHLLRMDKLIGLILLLLSVVFIVLMFRLG